MPVYTLVRGPWGRLGCMPPDGGAGAGGVARPSWLRTASQELFVLRLRRRLLLKHPACQIVLADELTGRRSSQAITIEQLATHQERQKILPAARFCRGEGRGTSLHTAASCLAGLNSRRCCKMKHPPRRMPEARPLRIGSLKRGVLTRNVSEGRSSKPETSVRVLPGVATPQASLKRKRRNTTTDLAAQPVHAHPGSRSIGRPLPGASTRPTKA